MKMNTKFFGEVEFADRDKIFFPEGIYGKAEETEFLMLNNFDTEDPVPFMWLQSIKDPEFSLVLAIPFFLNPSYEFDIPDEVCEKLEITRADEVGVYAVCNISDEVKDMSYNLMSPIIINSKSHVGSQIVLYDTKYKVKEKFEKK